MKNLFVFLIVLCASLPVVLAQTGSASEQERDLVRRELQFRLSRDRGYDAEVHIDTADSSGFGNENTVRGRAQYRERGNRWETIWYEAVVDARRNRVSRIEWGYGNRQGGRDDYRYDDRQVAGVSGPIRSGRYTIQLVATNRMLDISGNQVVQRSASNARSQMWDIEDAGGGYYYLRSAETGEVMSADGRADNGARIVLTRERRGDDYQLWEVRAGPDNGYYFIARNGKSMDSPSSARHDGGHMQLYSRNGEANQRFRLQLIDDRSNYGWRDRGRDRDRFDPRDRGRDTFGGSGRLNWSGRVDGEIEIEIRGSSARERHISGQPPYGVRVNTGWSLPRRDVSVRVERLRGRGRVELIAQPSARNGYTAVIRISDPERGADNYEIEVSWN